FAAPALGQPASDPTGDLAGEVAALKADNAALQEQLRKLEEQQKVLLERIESLQQKLGTTAAAAPPEAPSTAAAVPPAAPPAPAGQTEKKGPFARYEDGMVVAQTADDAKVPFLLKFNVNTQVRYLNTTDSPQSFSDHLGVAREVHVRNDITVNRTMFILG